MTTTERLILASQFRILAALNEDDAKLNEAKAEILEKGYKPLYKVILRDISEAEDQSDVYEETMEILDMFRHIEISLKKMHEKDKEGLNLMSLKFSGFDMNDVYNTDFHTTHYQYLEFLVENFPEFVAIKDVELNSHSELTLPEYRRMLKIWREYKGKGLFDRSILQKLTDVA